MSECQERDRSEPSKESDRGPAEEEPYTLDDLPDGSGCAEIWEHLSDRRRGSD